MRHVLATLLRFACLTLASAAFANGPEPRARDLGVPFDGTPGTNNAITDVAGVEVGFKTLISGDGALVRGKGPVRTGVTAILLVLNDEFLLGDHVFDQVADGNQIDELALADHG